MPLTLKGGTASTGFSGGADIMTLKLDQGADTVAVRGGYHHHGGYHHGHHLNARIPFYRLPEAMAGLEELQSPGVTTLSPLGVYRCLRLKLWDPDLQRLVNFAGD